MNPTTRQRLRAIWRVVNVLAVLALIATAMFSPSNELGLAAIGALCLIVVVWL